MKAITKEDLNKKKELIKTLNARLKTLRPIADELKEDEKVKKYIEIDKEINSASYRLKRLAEEIKYQEMYHCDHYFVVNEQRSDYDGHRYEKTTIKTCIHCGLTNQYMDYYMDSLFPQYNEINQVFIDNGAYSYKTHGYCNYNEIKEVKKLYDKFKEEYPDATDDVIEEQISLVKKIRGGKLC